MSNDIFDLLPDGVRHLLFSYLKNKDFKSVPVVSRKWRGYAGELNVLKSRYRDPELTAEQRKILFNKLLECRFSNEQSIEAFVDVAWYTKECFKVLSDLLDEYTDNITIKIRNLHRLYKTPLSEIKKMDSIEKDAKKLKLVKAYCDLVGMATLIDNACDEVCALYRSYPLASEIMMYYLMVLKREITVLNNTEILPNLIIKLFAINDNAKMPSDLVIGNPKNMQRFNQINMSMLMPGLLPISFFVLLRSFDGGQDFCDTDLQLLKALGCQDKLQQTIIQAQDYNKKLQLENEGCSTPIEMSIKQYLANMLGKYGSQGAYRDVMSRMLTLMHPKTKSSHVEERVRYLSSYLVEQNASTVNAAVAKKRPAKNQ